MRAFPSLFARSLALLSLAGCSRAPETSTTTTTSSASPAAAGSVSSAPRRPAPAPVEAAPSGVMSCQQKMMCAEWAGLTLSELKEARDSCQEPGERFGAGACPRQNLVGICKHRRDKVTMYIYKSLVTASPKEAKELCDDGEFSAPTK